MHSLLPFIDNPLDGIYPDFSFLGIEFTNLWMKLVAVLWGLALIVTVVMLIRAIGALSVATSTANAGMVAVARGQLIWAVIALGLLVALPVIVGAILAVFGS